LVSFPLICQNTWDNQFKRGKDLFWLIVSEDSVHGQLTLLFLGLWQEYQRRAHGETKLLTSWKPGSKKKMCQVPISPTMSYPLWLSIRPHFKRFYHLPIVPLAGDQAFSLWCHLRAKPKQQTLRSISVVVVVGRKLGYLWLKNFFL
jgi:hypothetical protein